MKRIRIFILEDEWLWAEAIISVINKHASLELAGEALSFEAGEAKILSAKPDIVFIDIRLKGEKNGIQATKEILKKLPRSKVIIFTSSPDERMLSAAIKAGAQAYLLKDEITEPQTVLQAIEAVHREKSFITPDVAQKVLSILRSRDERDHSRLSKRAREIISLIRDGKTNAQIAGLLHIGERTVANHISKIFEKLGVANRAEAVAKALREKLIEM